MTNMFAAHKIVTMILLIIGHQNNTIGFAAVPPNDCIMVVGGNYDAVHALPIEYYHPTNVQCDLSHIQTLHLSEEQAPLDASGCYFADTQQIVMRENRNLRNASVIYSLQNGTLTKIAPAEQNSKYSVGSTAASLDSSRCLSCGGALYSNECYKFNTSINSWTQIDHLPSNVSYAASVSLGTVYYVVGGQGRKNVVTKELYGYDTPTKKWISLSSMSTARFYHSATPLSKDEFITCGGYTNGYRSEATCEVYHTVRNEWRNVSDMLTDRNHFALVNFNGQVHAIGGNVAAANEKYKATVEVYNRSNDSWSMRESLKVHREGFVAFAVTLIPPKPTPPPTSITRPTITVIISPGTNTKTRTAKEAKTKKSKMSAKWIVILSLLGVVVVIVLIAVAVVCWLWCRKQHRRADKDSKNSEDFGSKKEEVFLPSSTADYQAWLKRNERQDGESVDDASTIDDSMMTDDTTVTHH